MNAESPTTPKRNKSKTIDHKTLFLIKEIEEIYGFINEKLQIYEIEQISPYSEKVLKILLKVGILNFYVIGSYIHCMILEVSEY